MSEPTVREIVSEMKSTTRALFEQVFLPRIEKQMDNEVHAWLERIVEKKIEERFAMAIELLRSTPLKKTYCSKHPDVEAFVYQKILGQTEVKCVWCIEADAIAKAKSDG